MNFFVQRFVFFSGHLRDDAVSFQRRQGHVAGAAGGAELSACQVEGFDKDFINAVNTVKYDQSALQSI